MTHKRKNLRESDKEKRAQEQGSRQVGNRQKGRQDLEAALREKIFAFLDES